MQSEFKQFLLTLRQKDVRFIVAGGLACALNGFIRVTEDVDILVDASPENIDRLLAVLARWGEGVAKDLTKAEFRLEPGAIRIEEDFPLDLFTVLNGKTYQDYIRGAEVSADGIQYLSIADLIETKQNTHREKDQIDILALRRILNRQNP